MELKIFLEKYVEGYLFGDIETMKRSVQQQGKDYGAVGYPLLISTIAGIELLGALTSTSTFDTNAGTGKKHFEYFWEIYLYPMDESRAKAGKHIYQLVRHGLAHTFVVKGNINVVKNNIKCHLVKDADGGIYIDAVQLAVDLEEAYKKFKTLLNLTEGPVNATTIKSRLNEIEKEYVGQSEKHMDNLISILPIVETSNSTQQNPSSNVQASQLTQKPEFQQSTQYGRVETTLPTMVASSAPFPFKKDS